MSTQREKNIVQNSTTGNKIVIWVELNRMEYYKIIATAVSTNDSVLVYNAVSTSIYCH